jgi:hypothetical protein
MTDSSRTRVSSPVRRVLLFSLLFWLVVGLGIYSFIHGPKQYVYRDGDWDGHRFAPEYDAPAGLNVLFDQHSHTTRYAGGALTPEQNLQWHIAMGFDACVISDKHNWDAAREARAIAREKYDHQIKVILGIEYGTSRGHLNILLPPDAEDYEEVIVNYGSHPTDDQLRSLIQAVHSLGGVVVVDHIPFSLTGMPTHPTRQQFFDWGADYIEVVGESGFDWDSYEFCRRTGMGMITGTGLHQPQKEPVYGWTLLNVGEFSEDAIFAELKAKNTSLVTNAGSPYPFQHEHNWRYTILRPLIQVGDWIEDYNPTGHKMDWTAVAVLVAWAYGGFAVVECLVAGWSRFGERVLERRAQHGDS